MNEELLDELKKSVEGDVAVDSETLATFSHDASLFEVKPQVVVYPKDAEDVQALVKFVEKNKKEHRSRRKR